MAKKRIADIAEKHGLNAKDLSKQLQEAGFSVPSPNSTIDEKLALSVVKANEPTNGANHPQRIGDLPPDQQRRRPAPQQGGQRSGQGGQRPGGPGGQRSGGPGGQRSAGPGGRGPGGPGGRGPGGPGGRGPGGP